MSDLTVAGRPKRAPTHPGAVLREDVLPALKMTIKDAAIELGISRQALHAVLNGTAAVTPEMALRLGKFCGNGPDFWLRMQHAYDLWKAQEKLGEELARLERIPSHSVA